MWKKVRDWIRHFGLVAGKPSERSGAEPGVYTVDPDDEDMNAAIQEARRTLDVFVSELASSKKHHRLFSVKVTFPQDDGDGNEHIWLDDVSYQNGHFTGTVGNVPRGLSRIHPDNTLTIHRDAVTDWNIVDGNKATGGFTVRVLRRRMSAEERADFDERTRFAFK
jgi:uncharacterized protein YegJ (DUF2314 family)